MRTWLRRFAVVLLLAASVTLIGLSRIGSPWVESTRTFVVDLVTPALAALSRPIDAVSDWFDGLYQLTDVRSENQRLRQKISSQRQWEHRARQLEAENRTLRKLLVMTPKGAPPRVTARVIADPGHTFVRSVLINAGTQAGLRKGLAAVNDEGLVGRVTHVGARSARVLLLTDLNSRIPVLVERSRDRAILAGDNTGLPRLIYLPVGVTPEAGDRIVTSGHGGVFPAGLAVGVVVSLSSRGARVQARVKPYVNWNRLEFLRIIDHPIRGIIPATQAAGRGRKAKAK
ncbi:MAG: rod shape-determining protein MreC [Alphaproteobacteria bacterium]